MELFWEQGYEATSAQDLVDHLGIGRSSLYGTFGSKHELYLKALNHYRRRSDETARRLFAQSDSPKEVIHRIFELTADGVAQDPRGCFMANATAERAGCDEDVREIASENFEELQETFADLVEQGQKQGEFSEELKAEAVGRFLAVAQYGLRITARTEPSEEEVRETVDTVLSVLE